MNYNEAVKYIDDIKNLGSKPGLERITELAAKLGNPQNSLKIIHVTGTNGKGSVCAMIDSVLSEAGYKTGRFTSPWIERINEHISFCGEEISDAEFAEIISKVKEAADKMTDSPTEFEIITAAAFLCFKVKKCDVVIVETGMGGLLDATNIIEKPILSVVTCVSKDHTNFLGDSIEDIATQKSGIIKSKVPVLWGGEDKEAKKVIMAKAKEMGCEFFTTDKAELISSDITGSEFEYRGLKVKIPLPGVYQLKNAAIAMDAVDILFSEGIKTTDDDIVGGLSKVKWKGRFEVLSKTPLLIFDGGHNLHGVVAVAESIKEYFGGEKIIFLTGVLADKDHCKMAKVLEHFARKVFAVTPDSARALSAADYAENFTDGMAEICASFEEAIKKSLALAKKENLPVVAVGSLYMYKDIINIIKEQNR